MRGVDEALAATAAVRAAGRVGIADRLAGGPATAAEVASRCGLSERGARATLTALVSMGLAELIGAGLYRALPPLGPLVAYAELWERFPEAMLSRGPAAAWDTPDTASRYYPAGVGLLAEMFHPAASRAAELLAGDGMVPRSVLDVGAGAAPWSLALAARAPGCTVTALDLPSVLDVTRSAVSAAGRGAQYRYLPGNMFEAELGGPYDLVLVANVCHLFGEQPNRRLLQRLHRAVEPGGRLAIVDVLPAEGPDLARRVALYELSLVLRTEDGAVHSFSSYAAWLRAAGFAGIDRLPLGDEHGLVLILARRAALHESAV